MSQQKVLLAVCVVVASVALVSGQSMDLAKCIQNSRAILRKYATSFQSLAQTYSDSMLASGNQAFDVQAFNSDVQVLVQQYTALTNFSEGLSAQKYLEHGYKIMSSQFRFVTKYFMNPSLGLSAMSATVDLSTKIMHSNAKLIQELAAACSIDN